MIWEAMTVHSKNRVWAISGSHMVVRQTPEHRSRDTLHWVAAPVGVVEQFSPICCYWSASVDTAAAAVVDGGGDTLPLQENALVLQMRPCY